MRRSARGARSCHAARPSPRCPHAAVNYVGPERNWGQVNAIFNATILDEYVERTANVDGTETVTGRTGTHTSETFQRAFPELRWVTDIDWMRDRWTGSLSFRWTDEMTAADGSTLDSALFTDLRVSYTPDIRNDAVTVAVGFNNVLDEDPPILGASTIGMSNVLHGLPGRVGYIRFVYHAE